MKEMVESLAETLGVSAVMVRTGICIVCMLLLAAAVFCIYRFCTWCDRKASYRFYKENIPETERQLSDLQMKIIRLERDLEFCQAVVQDKVLTAAKELNLAVMSDETKWLVETCQKIDTKKIRKKLTKKKREAEECEEWLREAREEYAALSEKFGGREI